jgi:mannose-6-phosphate isomerase-like protein (cupin superfamily)
MKHKLARFGKGFRILVGNQRSQAAQMTLPPGAAEGGPDNRHVGADQWLFVVAGKGEAKVNRRKYALEHGSLLLIERGDLHEIRNTGTTPLKTLSIYVPPAYTADGEELPAGKSA